MFAQYSMKIESWYGCSNEIQTLSSGI